MLEVRVQLHVIVYVVPIKLVLRNILFLVESQFIVKFQETVKFEVKEMIAVITAVLVIDILLKLQETEGNVMALFTPVIVNEYHQVTNVAVFPHIALQVKSSHKVKVIEDVANRTNGNCFQAEINVISPLIFMSQVCVYVIQLTIVIFQYGLIELAQANVQVNQVKFSVRQYDVTFTVCVQFGVLASKYTLSVELGGAAL